MKNFKETLIAITLMIAMVLVNGCGKDTPATDNNDLPMVQTTAVTDITGSSVTCGGVVTSNAGSVIVERGVCWSKTPNPLVSDFRQVVGGDLGSFSCELTGLEPNTTYYLKAYAINGNGVGYGSVVCFKTLSEQPSNFSPSIAVLQGEEYVHDGDIINAYEEFNIGFVMSSSIESGKELASLTVVIDDETFETVSLEGTEYTYVRTLAFNIRDDMTDLVITATVSDEAGRTASVTMTLIIDLAQELIPEAFEWYRFGTTPGVGLEEFGLEWTTSYKYIHARIRPMGDVLLFMFDPWVWYEVTTEAEKAALFADAFPIEEYNNVVVSVESMDYDDVLGTLLPDGTMHLIHVVHSEAHFDDITRIFIFGEAK